MSAIAAVADVVIIVVLESLRPLVTSVEAQSSSRYVSVFWQFLYHILCM